MARRKTRARLPEGDPAAGYLGGHVLIAMPSMRDPRFAQTVICLCAHSREGAMGLVLNKRVDGLNFDALLKQLDIAPTPPARRIRLLNGGPVDAGRGFVLHSADWNMDDSLRVTPEVSMTASLDILKALAEGGGPRQGVLALGYAGWAPGQLEDEIQGNAWLSVPADEALIFDEDLEHKWQAAFGRLKVDPLLLSSAAGHA